MSYAPHYEILQKCDMMLSQHQVARMSTEKLLQIYYFMRLTRTVEDRTRTLFLQGRVVGGVYTAQGHEATTVGAAMMLSEGDCIVPQHRDLGMHLVRGG